MVSTAAIDRADMLTTGAHRIRWVAALESWHKPRARPGVDLSFTKFPD
jgi:hypothetical protein